jgi:putative flippase GtrA
MSSKLAVSTRFVDLDAMTSLGAALSTEFDERVGHAVGVPVVLISAFFANDKISFQQSL